MKMPGYETVSRMSLDWWTLLLSSGVCCVPEMASDVSALPGFPVFVFSVDYPTFSNKFSFFLFWLNLFISNFASDHVCFLLPTF